MKSTFFIAIFILGVSLNCLAQLHPVSTTVNSKQMLADLQYLSADEMNGRFVGTSESAKAREFIIRRFKESNVMPIAGSFLHQFEFSPRQKPNEKTTGINVIGFIKGKKYPERYIVITAHYDHISRQNGQVMNGANDNASGTAALFALGEYFSKNSPRNSIVFAALDAEEVGLVGARKFVEKPPIPIESIILNLNMDMIARDRKETLYAVGTYHYPYLKPILQKVVNKSKIKFQFGYDIPNVKGVEDWTFSSDHAAFHRVKIPFIYFGVEDFENHHKSTDDYETIMPTFYVRAVETIIESTKAFDQNLDAIALQRSKK